MKKKIVTAFILGIITTVLSMFIRNKVICSDHYGCYWDSGFPFPFIINPGDTPSEFYIVPFFKDIILWSIVILFLICIFKKLKRKTSNTDQGTRC